ncbi:MAG: nucleotidyltransferase family protein [Acidimicrobiia bacterium]
MPIHPRLLALAGAGLPAAPALPPGPWDDQLPDVFAHGLAGLLAAGAAAGKTEISAEVAARLRSRLEAEAVQAVQLEGELLRLGSLLESFPMVVLKGAVLAHRAYPDPLLRPFTDLDLLVPGPRLPEAVAALEALGYARARPEPAPGYDARVGKAVAVTHPGGVIVDLHRTLAAGAPGAAVDVESVVADRRPLSVGTVTVPAPSWEAQLVAVALHAVVGDGLARALSIRDVAEVARHPLVQPAVAVELAENWQVADELALGLRAAADLGATLPEPLATLARRAHGARSVIGPTRAVRSARSRLDDLRHGDVRRRATLTRAMVAPSPAFLRWAYGTLPLPQLYGRRWRALYRRAGVAHTAPEVAPVTAAPGEAGVDPSEPARPPSEVPSAPVGVVALAGHSAPGPVRPRSGAPAGARPGGRQARWSAARPPRPPAGGPPFPPAAATADADDRPAPHGDSAQSVTVAPPPASGVPWALGGGALLLATAAAAQMGAGVGLVTVPVAAVLLAVGASRRIARLRPDEAWVGRWLVLGVVAKLTASYLRYLTLVVGYEGVGDATGYDGFGRQFAAAWLGDGTAPELPDLRRTNFIRWFTGVVYYVFGSDMLAGFFVFGLLALVGSYLWYRATATAVPMIDKRLYLGLVLFAPSIAFWPSSIGKESLMQLGIGTVALGTAHLLRQRLLVGMVVGAAGGWLLWVVRPHLLALVTVAAGCAYVAGRVQRAGSGSPSLLGRPVGLLVVAMAMAFTVSQGAKFLGIEQLSLSSIEAELDEQTERSAQGGSQFDNGGNSLSPLKLPEGAVTVLLRPFPWETDSPFQLLSSLESVLLAAFLVARLPSLKTALVSARGTPFLLYCWVLTILYAATFSSFANFGLLVRQRSLVLPALFVLLAVTPLRRRAESHDALGAPVAAAPEPEARVALG